ncbi:MAG TPA: serine hydrolase [Dokdonella sp.]|uniref:serine hydrolase n=1 Tax=Dokdonella sp. TaxID=2291710 RepID=UPI002C584BA1|nr:serine hydrolase [Dokdonella sp.]HUD42367.1 serine hydrolase [Dokdonella sp.]
MNRRIGVLFGLLIAACAQARPLYVDGFEPPSIAPLFPVANGQFQLPPGPAADQLGWLIGELAAGQTTTIPEIEAHFDPAWLAQTSAEATRSFIEAVRTRYPDARITDVIGLTPVRATVVIDSPGSGPPSGFVSFGTRYTGGGRITLLGVSSYGGSVQYPVDRTLTMSQAVAKFATLSSSPALLVGRIGAGGVCSAIDGHQPDTPRATASIFKIWVLGALGRGIAAGPIASAESLPMVASEIAPGGVINAEPVGTPFTIAELAALMIGISDNTATDLLHERVGRAALSQTVAAYAVAEPDLLLPFLNISEQFHLFRSFPLADALGYVQGSQAYKQQFLTERIEPLGPNSGGAYFHTDLLTSGTWRASPLDVCRAFGQLRRLPQGSEALATVDAALGAQAAQPDVRGRWDRVWYKGGSLASGAGDHVLTHAWMLENAGEDPYVVVAMANSAAGGIDPYAVQSITGRLLELVWLAR